MSIAAILASKGADVATISGDEPLSAAVAVLGDDDGVDAPAHQEVALDAHVARFGRADELVEDLVGHRLVEVALVSEAPQVELEGLELHAQLGGHVLDQHGGKVWLAGYRAQTSELWDFHMNMKISTGIRVRKSFQ